MYILFLFLKFDISGYLVPIAAEGVGEVLQRENLLASKKRTELNTGEMVDTSPERKDKVALLRNRRLTAVKTYQRDGN